MTTTTFDMESNERPPITDEPRDDSRMTDSASLVARTTIQNRKRALAKTVAYRVLMLVVTVLVALAVTGSIGQALGIGLVANAVKTGTYYAHERLWDRITWGVRDPDSA